VKLSGGWVAEMKAGSRPGEENIKAWLGVPQAEGKLVF
jgi:hypothetical protein